MYTLDDYYDDLTNKTLAEVWQYILNNDIPKTSDDFKIEQLGERYEDGLARTNKIAKKEAGKYYTPEDVAKIMGQELWNLPGDNICDVCCGVGNLIIAALKLLPDEQAVNLIKTGKIWLYDIDIIAVSICLYTLKTLYNLDDITTIHTIIGDFLQPNIKLPTNCKVISNPPYGKITLANIDAQWDEQTIVRECKDWYGAIMAKIIHQANAVSIITPHSFMYSDKFQTLRTLMVQYGGHIYAFDNVPGNIFNGKKFGIFNTNNVNSVRAAITIVDKNIYGYNISPFIRFASAEREQILKIDYLKTLLPQIKQTNDDCFYRIAPGTDNIVSAWLKYSTLNNYISETNQGFTLTIPNSCRYYLCGVNRNLKRTGKLVIYPKDANSYLRLYVMLNSSFGYYWHRLCNGGITYPMELLKTMPIINDYDITPIKPLLKEMITKEDQYLAIARNAGAEQENIKFPEEYRNRLNQFLCEQMKVEYNQKWFDDIHSNSMIKIEAKNI